MSKLIETPIFRFFFALILDPIIVLLVLSSIVLDLVSGKSLNH